jgi:hypothetical protein
MPNITFQAYGAVIIDRSPPTTSIHLDGIYGESNWFTSDVSVSLSATDNYGVYSTGYSLGNDNWLNYTVPFRLTSEGKTTVLYSSTDVYGNVESTKYLDVNIDKTPPEATLTINGDAEETNNTEVIVTSRVVEFTSGISQMRFSNDGANWGGWQPYSMSASWTLESGYGEKTVYLEVNDRAGLTSRASDSIILIETVVDTGPGIGAEYIAAVSVGVAGVAITGAAYIWMRKRSVKGRGKEKKGLAPPLFTKLRWIQGQVFEVLSRGEKVRRMNALRANALHNLIVRIGPADQDWITSLKSSPEEKLALKDGFSNLKVVFSEPNHAPEPQVGKIKLPREGSSTTCEFSFSPREDTAQFRGRVIVLSKNRVLQTALLEGEVVSDPDQFSDLKLKFGIESIIQPNLSDLSSRQAFDLAFLANHTMDNSPGLTTIAEEEAFFKRLPVEGPVKEITRLLEDVLKHPDEYPRSIENRKNVEWLRKLAIKGKDLYDGIVVDQIGPKRLLNINRVQLVSTVDAYLPLEFIYDMPVPKCDATLCPCWREALERGRCEKCEIKGTFGPVDYLCPIGFWGLRLIVERQYFDPYNRPDMKGYDFSLRGESVGERPVLKVLRSAVFAASDKVDEVVAGSQDVLGVLEELTHHKVEQVATLEEWRNAVLTLQPSLIVLLTHISPYSMDPEMSQMEIGKGVGLPRNYITSQYLLPSEDAPRPVVLLLGCRTMSTKEPFRGFAASFRRQGAAVVLSTITEVLGRHVAPVSALLITDLEKVAEKHLSLGDALVLVRRKALAEGLPMVLSLVGIGDADWKFDAVEAG